MEHSSYIIMGRTTFRALPNSRPQGQSRIGPEMEQALPNTTVSTGNLSELGNMCSVQKVTCQQLVATPGCGLHIARYSNFF